MRPSGWCFAPFFAQHQGRPQIFGLRALIQRVAGYARPNARKAPTRTRSCDLISTGGAPCGRRAGFALWGEFSITP